MIVFSLVLALAAPSASYSAALFKAAGFHRVGKHWRSDCDDPGTASYSPGAIELFCDLNGDGRPEAVVTEGGTYCYGNTGTGFTLLTKNAAGAWRTLHSSNGVATFLPVKAKGWPDIEVGGPGFCFPVLRWTGTAYAVHRHAYQGRRCAR